MNNHLLPFPYNHSRPPTWLERAAQPLSNILLGEPKHSAPQKPPPGSIPLYNNGDDLPPIRVICISDTHNATLPLPPGDILIHGGDLTAHGTFDEVQAQLRWLSSQPHPHKIVIAGNHDIILDEACDAKFLTRNENSAEERKKLDWSGIRYLQDEAVTLELAVSGPGGEQHVRKVKIYGSALTPEFGSWAFQYPSIRDVWTGRVPDDTDILVVHGPPALYGDCDGEMGSSGRFKVKGNGYLLREIRRVRPRLVVCGHIHGAFGIVTVQHDGTQEVMDGLRMRWEGYGLVGALKQPWNKLLTQGSVDDRTTETLVVNAAVAPSVLSDEEKSAIAIDFH